MSMEDRLSELNTEFQENIEQKKSLEETKEIGMESKEISETNEDYNEMASLASLSTPGLFLISKTPEVRNIINEKVDDCKETFLETLKDAKDSLSEKVSDAKNTISEFSNKVNEGIKDFLNGVYENANDFINDETKEKVNPIGSQFPEAAKLNEGITEGREFGLDECTDAAMEIFNPGVINEWDNIPLLERKGIAMLYADRVAEAFHLENYQGVYIEDLPDNILGSNNGDGSIHLDESLIADGTTPFSIIDTITHELRHQYQSECVNGFHNVSDEVRNEWAVATEIYNYDRPSSYDPWGYAYNPLEIDSNYAGNTVVRNMSSQIFNDTINKMNV